MMELDTRGPYDLYGNSTSEYIDVFPTVLKDVLEKAGFNYKRVMKDWEDNKILNIYTDRNNKEFTSHAVKFFDKTKKVKRINIQDIE